LDESTVEQTGNSDSKHSQRSNDKKQASTAGDEQMITGELVEAAKTAPSAAKSGSASGSKAAVRNEPNRVLPTAPIVLAAEASDVVRECRSTAADPPDRRVG
jgi:hypothetical protein